VAGLVAVVASAAGCGGGAHHAADASPSTTLVTVDHWSPPVVVGPPSSANFCTLLVANYQHLNSLADAPKLRVRQQIVTDYVAFTPKVIASAPGSIQAAASVYLGSIATVLRQLNSVGLDSAKLHSGDVAALLLNPKVRVAGDSVLAYSADDCHYDIGS
jgi:hypothetical protein